MTGGGGAVIDDFADRQSCKKGAKGAASPFFPSPYGHHTGGNARQGDEGRRKPTVIAFGCIRAEVARTGKTA